MQTLLKNTFSAIKSRPDVFFFYLFILTSTLSIRKVLYYFPINNNFNEYTGVYIYLSDIFLALTIFFWLFLLCNNICYLSNKLPGHVHYLSVVKNDTSTKKNVSRETLRIFKNVYSHVIHNYLLFFPLLMGFFSFCSILWATNRTTAIFSSIKLSEFILLYFYISWIVSRETFLSFSNISSLKSQKNLFHVKQTKDFLNILFTVIISIGMIQALIGIAQFFIQHSIGLFWLKESIISPSLPGVAKIILNGKVYIRAYGLFPHPNILGGFLVFSILITSLSKFMFHVEHKQEADYKKHILVPRGTILKAAIAIQFFALLITFSKSAIIGLAIAFFYIILAKNAEKINGLRFKKFVLFHVKQYLNILIFFLLAFFFLYFILKPDLNSLFFQSLRERILFLNIAQTNFTTSPLLGIGAGQFIPVMAKRFALENWQYQPVHNVFLLILNNFGLIIFLGYIYFIYKLFRVSLNNNDLIKIYFKGILVAFIFIMFFDHYLWDIQVGETLFWLASAFL